MNQNLNGLIEKFDTLIEPVKGDILKKAYEGMTSDEKFVMDTPENQLNLEQLQFKKDTVSRYLSNRFEVARSLPADKQDEAISLASSIRAAEEAILHTDAYRNMCNYNYWETRSQAEQSPVTLQLEDKSMKRINTSRQPTCEPQQSFMKKLG